MDLHWARKGATSCVEGRRRSQRAWLPAVGHAGRGRIPLSAAPLAACPTSRPQMARLRPSSVTMWPVDKPQLPRRAAGGGAGHGWDDPPPAAV